MNKIEARGATSAQPAVLTARPFSDILMTVPKGALVIAAYGSRTHDSATFELAYSLNGSICHLSFNQEGGIS